MGVFLDRNADKVEAATESASAALNAASTPVRRERAKIGKHTVHSCRLSR
jgi:hypothetical protein